MNVKRPVNLDLMTIQFPVMAIVSILHRLSGIALFVLMPVMLYFLALSLQSPDSFLSLKMTLAGVGYKILLWVFTTALVYHLLAGIRHMIMDLGIGESLGAGRASAVILILMSLVLSIFLGIWLW